MVYDSARGVALLFGGTGGTTYRDTWELGVSFYISQQPVNTTIVAGSDAAFGALAIGEGPINYQWRKDGVPIPAASGVNKVFFRIPSVSRADAGVYDVVVTSGDTCQLVSVPATMTVNYRADFDDDADVDGMDYGAFASCFNGSANPPACR